MATVTTIDDDDDDICIVGGTQAVRRPGLLGTVALDASPVAAAAAAPVDISKDDDDLEVVEAPRVPAGPSNGAHAAARDCCGAPLSASTGDARTATGACTLACTRTVNMMSLLSFTCGVLCRGRAAATGHA